MGKRRKTKWKTTAIPEDLYDRIKAVAKEAGCTGVNNFVRDACTRRLEELEKGVEVPAR